MTWKQPLAEMQGNTAYIRPKVVGPCASGSYVHRTALLKGKPGTVVKLLPCDHEVKGSSPGNNLFQKCGSYMHQAALFIELLMRNLLALCILVVQF
jgi:hypothetical protein